MSRLPLASLLKLYTSACPECYPQPVMFTSRIRGWIVLGTAMAFFCSIILGLSVRANNLVERVEKITTHQQSLNKAIDTITNTSNSPNADEVGRILTDMQTDLAAITREARWWLQLGHGLRWVPHLGADLAAPQALSRAAKADILAAKEILAGSDRLLQVFLSWGDPHKNPTIPLVAERMELLDAAQDTRFHFRRATISLLEAAKWHNELSSSPPSTNLNSYATSLAALHDEMLALSVWGDSALSLLPKMISLAEQIERAQGQLDMDINNLQPSQLIALLEELESLTEQARGPHQEITQLLDTAPNRITLNPIWAQVETSAEVMEILLRMGEALIDVAEVFEPILARAKGEGFSVAGEGSIIRSLGTLLTKQHKLRNASEDLKTALNELADLTGGNGNIPYLGTVSSLRNTTGKLSDALSLILDLLPLVEEFVDHESPRQYLVLGHNTDELRATGGYIFGLWLLSTREDELISTIYFDTVAVDDWSNLAGYPTPPQSLQEHMNAPVWLLRDVSWEPDFPITAQIAQEMFQLGQGVNTDGVIGINQQTIKGILSALGPIQVPGESQFINSENFSTIIEQGKDETGRAYLDSVLQGILQHLKKPHDLQSLLNLAKTIQSMLATKDLMIFSTNSEINQLLDQQGWSGKVYKGPGDHLFVIDSNIGWNKVDRNIIRETEYMIDLSTPETPSSKLTLTYTNQSATELDVAWGDGQGNTVSTSAVGVPKCDIQWQTTVPLTWRESLLYDYLTEACYWNFIRVYVPKSSKLLSASPLPLPVHSVASTVGFAQPGSETLEVKSEAAVTIFSGLFNIDPGQSRRLHFSYQMNSQILEQSEEFLTYNLMIQKQPGTIQRNTSVIIRIPSGYQMVSSNQQPIRIEHEILRFSFDLRQDTELQITLGPD